MTLLSIPANPVPEGALAGTIGTPDGVTLRFARWAAPAGGRGTVCVFTGRSAYFHDPDNNALEVIHLTNNAKG